VQEKIGGVPPNASDGPIGFESNQAVFSGKTDECSRTGNPPLRHQVWGARRHGRSPRSPVRDSDSRATRHLTPTRARPVTRLRLARDPSPDSDSRTTRRATPTRERLAHRGGVLRCATLRWENPLAASPAHGHHGTAEHRGRA